MIVYLDSSAWSKTFNASEPHREAFLTYLEGCERRRDVLVSNEILVLETLNLAGQVGVPFHAVRESHRKLNLVRNVAADGRSLFRDAGIRILPMDEFGNQRTLKALDKLHLETALQLQADVLVVYDAQFQRNARSLDLRVEAPGTKRAQP